MGYIKTAPINISFKELISDFNEVFNNPQSEKSDIIKVVNKYVPTFQHIETGKHLDQKM